MKTSPDTEGSPSEPPLDEGDPVEYSLSASVRAGGGEAWIRFQATGRVRPGEDPDDAARRVSEWVDGLVVAKAEELK